MNLERKQRRRIKMFEVTYTIDGLIKTISINANNVEQVNSILLNMYNGSKIEIINVKRI